MANGFQCIELSNVLYSAEMLPDFLQPTEMMKSLSLKDGKKDWCFLSLSFLRNLEKATYIPEYRPYTNNQQRRTHGLYTIYNIKGINKAECCISPLCNTSLWVW